MLRKDSREIHLRLASMIYIERRVQSHARIKMQRYRNCKFYTRRFVGIIHADFIILTFDVPLNIRIINNNLPSFNRVLLKKKKALRFASFVSQSQIDGYAVLMKQNRARVEQRIHR